GAACLMEASRTHEPLRADNSLATTSGQIMNKYTVDRVPAVTYRSHSIGAALFRGLDVAPRDSPPTPQGGAVMPDRLRQRGLLTGGHTARASSGVHAARRLSALALIFVAFAFSPELAAAGVFSFARTDYLLESHLNGLGSVAVGDLDGVNGPDIVV